MTPPGVSNPASAVSAPAELGGTVSMSGRGAAAAFPRSDAVSAIIRLALAEDVGRGDITTEATVAAETTAVAEILQKQDGVMCGLPVVEAVFAMVDPSVRVTRLAEEGSWGNRRVVARIEGRSGGVEHAFGVSPRYEDLRWEGLSFSREQFASVIGIDKAAWKQELALHTELFQQLEHQLPRELPATKARIEERLGA